MKLYLPHNIATIKLKTRSKVGKRRVVTRFVKKSEYSHYGIFPQEMPKVF